MPNHPIPRQNIWPPPGIRSIVLMWTVIGLGGIFLFAWTQRWLATGVCGLLLACAIGTWMKQRWCAQVMVVFCAFSLATAILALPFRFHSVGFDTRSIVLFVAKLCLYGGTLRELRSWLEYSKVNPDETTGAPSEPAA